MRKDGRTITASGGDNMLHHVSDPVLIEQAIHQTEAEQLLGFAFRPFVDFHGYSATCFAVSSARRRSSSGVRILPVTAAVACTTHRPTSRWSSASMWSCS